MASAVDPDLVGSETFGRIQIREKSLRIRVRAAQDPKWIWIWSKTDKIWQFLT